MVWRARGYPINGGASEVGTVSERCVLQLSWLFSQRIQLKMTLNTENEILYSKRMKQKLVHVRAAVHAQVTTDAAAPAAVTTAAAAAAAPSPVTAPLPPPTPSPWASWSNTRWQVAQVMRTPDISITTWIEVPALAGSTPTRASANGRPAANLMIYGIVSRDDGGTVEQSECPSIHLPSLLALALAPQRPPVPASTLASTMRKSEMAMAVALSRSPLVRYTRAQPPAASPAPSSSPTASCWRSARRTPGPVGLRLPVASPRMTLMAD